MGSPGRTYELYLEEFDTALQRAQLGNHWLGSDWDLGRTQGKGFWIQSEPETRNYGADIQVVFHDPFTPNGMDKALGIKRISTLENLLGQADVLSLHCTHNPQTHHIINQHTIKLLKHGAVLINTARGELVDLEAVYSALRSERLAGAGLDVVEVEPPVEPLPALLRAYRAREEWLMGRLIITPHVAFYCKESVEDMRRKSAETMRDVLFDGIPSNLIQLSAW